MGDAEVMREKLYSVGDSFALGFGNVASVVPVMVRCWSHVESPAGVFGPCLAVTYSIMDGYFTSGWTEWCGVIIKVAMDHGVR